MLSPQDRYLLSHCTDQGEALRWIERQTHIRTNYPQMLSGPVQGRLLTMIVQMTRARSILEIGCFTGYSTVCMAYGLAGGGHIDSLEINDELEPLIREGWERAGIGDKVTLHLGDAKDTLGTLVSEGRKYDLVFMDANKREYCLYYDLFFPLVNSGGIILADDILWDGKLFLDPIPQDAQTRGISRFNDMVASDPRVEVVLLPVRDGLGIIRKK